MHIRLAALELFHAGKLVGALLKLVVTGEQRKRSFVRQTQIMLIPSDQFSFVPHTVCETIYPVQLTHLLVTYREALVPGTETHQRTYNLTDYDFVTIPGTDGLHRCRFRTS